MRIVRVIGKVTMNRTVSDIVPGSYLLVRPCGRAALAAKGPDSEEELVLFDNLGAREGDLAGMVEGREAAQPFHPQKVPFDAYNACILDTVSFRPILEVP
jgi:microcompartment protein CcmK/EutM